MPALPAAKAPAPARPAVIAHYHIYKNAGSSVDAALRACFGPKAVMELDKAPETRDHKAFNRPLVEHLAGRDPRLRAFSCHRFVTNAHRSETLTVLPIVFLRHPLLRVASVYRFERIREDDHPGKDKAREMAFPDWLDWYVGTKNGRNYQTCVLSIHDNGAHSPYTVDRAHLGDIRLATARLDEIRARTAVGLVEEFEASARRIEAAIKPWFPEFSLARSHSNATKPVTDWRAELEALEAGLPPRLLRRFVEENAQDYALYQRYRALFERGFT